MRTLCADPGTSSATICSSLCALNASAATSPSGPCIAAHAARAVGRQVSSAREQNPTQWEHTRLGKSRPAQRPRATHGKHATSRAAPRRATGRCALDRPTPRPRRPARACAARHGPRRQAAARHFEPSSRRELIQRASQAPAQTLESVRRLLGCCIAVQPKAHAIEGDTP